MKRPCIAATTAAILACSVLGGGRGIAGEANQETSTWWLPTECAQSLEADGAVGLRCLNYRLGGVLADYAANLIEQQGQTLFGNNFGFVHRLSWSPFSAGASRDIDAVFPLQFAAGGEVARPESALFLQQGVTRWQDNDGFTRNDVRQGIVYRFALSEAPESIFGVAAFVQENVERKHRRLTMSLDYAGRYGRGWLQHFVPASGWQPGRPGYEERPIGGTEAGMRLAITSTLSLDAVLARWNGGGRAGKTDGRIGFGLQPHPWISLRADYESRFQVAEGTVRALLTIPLGGRQKAVPHWEGMGKRAVSAASTSGSLWRPVENVNQLATVERAISPAVTARAGSIAIEFLQTEAVTGSNISVRVSISAPLSEDLPLVLRLAPGSGSNPAVPGEDFADEAQNVTIAQGETSATAYFQLLNNAGLQTDRSLAVTVSLAATL